MNTALWAASGSVIGCAMTALQVIANPMLTIPASDMWAKFAIELILASVVDAKFSAEDLQQDTRLFIPEQDAARLGASRVKSASIA